MERVMTAERQAAMRRYFERVCIPVDAIPDMMNTLRRDVWDGNRFAGTERAMAQILRPSAIDPGLFGVVE